jgi:hypothetical protein
MYRMPLVMGDGLAFLPGDGISLEILASQLADGICDCIIMLGDCDIVIEYLLELVQIGLNGDELVGLLDQVDSAVERQSLEGDAETLRFGLDESPVPHDEE